MTHSMAMPDLGHAAMDPPRLILVGWTPSQLSSQRPEELDRVIHNVVKIGMGLGVELDEVSCGGPRRQRFGGSTSA